MSTNPDIPEPPIPRATPSPRPDPLEHSEYPPGLDSGEQEHPDDAPDDKYDAPYPEPNAEQSLLPPANFRPFFALIEDTTSGEYYHPYIHYVFADDDPTIVTAASMRGLGLDDTRYLPQVAPAAGERQRNLEGDEEEVGDEDEQNPPVESPFPPPIPGVKEHYLIVDVAADGRTILDAQSLSSEWQITDTGMRTAPSFDEDSPDPGYMLRIEGVEIPRKGKGKGKGEAGMDKLSEAREQQGDIFGALEGLVRGIERGLGIAEKISTAGRREGEEGITSDVGEEDGEKIVGDEQ